jgi:hypothetical protein
MASTPNYVTTPKCAVAQISTANTNRDGTGTIGTVFSAGASGSRIERIRVVATGTTTAGMVRLFIHDGTNARLYRELSVSAITPSGTVGVFTAEINYIGDNPLLLPNGYSLRASTHNAETFNVIAEGGDF